MGTFTYYETEIAEDSTDFISAVRFMVNDTDSTNYDLSDEVITALYNQTDTTLAQIERNYLTAISAQEYICNKRADNISAWSSAGTSVTYGSKGDCDDKLQRLRMKLLSLQGYSGILYPQRPSSFGW